MGDPVRCSWKEISVKEITQFLDLHILWKYEWAGLCYIKDVYLPDLIFKNNYKRLLEAVIN